MQAEGGVSPRHWLRPPGSGAWAEDQALSGVLLPGKGRAEGRRGSPERGHQGARCPMAISMEEEGSEGPSEGPCWPLVALT